MPFVCVEEERQNAFEEPTLDEFRYMTALEFGNVAEVVSFAGASKEVMQIADALLSLGVAHLYCRYDGGHDEGFAHVHSAVMRDGSRIASDALLERVMTTASSDEVKAAFQVTQWPPSLSSLNDALNWEFAHGLAELLLFQGYGTGEHYLFGAFTADLEARLLIDDPEAKPVSRNLSVAGLDD